jgi:uncharacterized delta-60 repeat protein
MARMNGHRAVVLALGIASTCAVGCDEVSEVASRSPGHDGGADADASPVRDAGSRHLDATAEAEAEAGRPAAPGSPDVTFGDGGTGMVTLTSVAPAFLGPHSLAVQSNGAIVYAGEYETSTQDLYALLAGRVLANGAVDTSFNLTGYFTAEQNGYWDEVGVAMTLDPSERVQIDGFIDPNTEPNHEMFTVRLTPSGQLDPAFGGGMGFVAIADNNIDSKADALLVQPDGKVLLAGFQGPQGAVARLNADGTLDSSYGPPNDAGVDGAALYPGLSTVTQLGLAKNGDVLAAVSGTNFQVLALSPTGTIDTSYGTSGIAGVTIQAPLTAGPDMVVLSDGSAVCVGSTSTTIELVRFTPAGQLDDTFGQAGRASVPSSLTTSSIARMPDGSLAVAVLDPANIIGVMKFSSSGALDPTFGASGIQTLSVGVNNSAALTIDAMGRIILGAGTTAGVVLARLNP